MGVGHTDESAQHSHGGWVHQQWVSTTFLTTWKNCHWFFLCSWQGSNFGSLDPESYALPIEPSRHPHLTSKWCQTKRTSGVPWVAWPAPEPVPPTPSSGERGRPCWHTGSWDRSLCESNTNNHAVSLTTIASHFQRLSTFLSVSVSTTKVYKYINIIYI